MVTRYLSIFSRFFSCRLPTAHCHAPPWPTQIIPFRPPHYIYLALHQNHSLKLIRHIQFAETFQVQKLQQEVCALEANLWKDHYNTTNYQGSWSTIQLRSVNGSLYNNTAMAHSAIQNGTGFRDTPLMQCCPYIKEVSDFFEMEKTAIRLMKLDAGAIIKPHSDPNLNFEDGEIRIHIPVFTNPQLFFYLDGERVWMEEGSCWYMNLSLQHSVRNEGSSSRIHLVIDGIVNDWVKEYVARPQHSIAYTGPAPAPGYNLHDQQKIIAQLRLLNTETAHRLADEMETQLFQNNA